jgi:hypothetical protein
MVDALTRWPSLRGSPRVAATALLLARRGLRVLVIDQQREYRDI